MKILSVSSLPLEGLRVIRFARFADHRGYFTEHYRTSDFDAHPDLLTLRDVRFVQCNESFSRAGVVRGLHFQWNPFMGKLVRTISGRMVDLVLDIRKGSPTYGRAVAYDMPADPGAPHAEWIWMPPGFAHGNFFTQDTVIEYLCSGQYSPGCEAGISPLAADIDWSLCDPHLRDEFRRLSRDCLITDKDRDALSLAQWTGDPRSQNFTSEACATRG